MSEQNVHVDRVRKVVLEGGHPRERDMECAILELADRLDAMSPPPPSGKGEVVRAADGNWVVQTDEHWLSSGYGWLQRYPSADRVGNFPTEALAIAAREKAPPPPGQGEAAQAGDKLYTFAEMRATPGKYECTTHRSASFTSDGQSVHQDGDTSEGIAGHWTDHRNLFRRIQPAPPAPQPSEGATTPRPEVMAERMVVTRGDESKVIGIRYHNADTLFCTTLVAATWPDGVHTNTGAANLLRSAFTAALTAQREAGAEEERKRAEKELGTGVEAIPEVFRRAMATERANRKREREEDSRTIQALLAERDALAARVREGEKRTKAWRLIAENRGLRVNIRGGSIDAMDERTLDLLLADMEAALLPTPSPAPEQPKPDGAGCCCCHCEPVVAEAKHKPLEVGVAYPASIAIMERLVKEAMCGVVDYRFDNQTFRCVVTTDPAGQCLLRRDGDGRFNGYAGGGTLTIVALPGAGESKCS